MGSVRLNLTKEARTLELVVQVKANTRDMAMFIEKLIQISLLVVILASQQLTVNGGLVGQYFITTPTNLTVNTGTKVTLPCVVGNIAGACQWTKDGFGLGTDRQLPNYDRFTMGSDDERAGHCDLVIQPVLAEDGGVYQCQVSGAHGAAPIISKPATLKVLSEPGQPHIVQAKNSDFIEVADGDEIELQCESHGGKPAADLSWFTGSGQRLLSDVTQHVSRVENTDLFKTVSILKHVVNGPQEIICEAHSDAFPKARKSRTLKIGIAKSSEYEVKKVKEGESFIIECSDSPVTGHQPFIWLFNDIEQPMETSNAIKIEEFTPDYDGSVLKCLSRTYDGKTRLVKQVTLKHEPDRMPKALPRISNNKRLKETSEKEPKGGEKIVVTCIATEEGEMDIEPEYVWVKGSLKKMNGSSKTSFTTYDENNREFKCKVVPNGHQRLRQVGVKMKTMSKEMRKFSKYLDKFTTNSHNP